jgi:hypothetical protein
MAVQRSDQRSFDEASYFSGMQKLWALRPATRTTRREMVLGIDPSPGLFCEPARVEQVDT